LDRTTVLFKMLTIFSRPY